MAIRMTEGFETRQSSTYLARAWQTLAGALTAFSAQRKAGNASGQGTNFTLTSWPLVPADSNVWILGFGYYMNATTCASTVTLMDDTATAQLSLVFATGTTANTFTIAVKRGATTLATTGEILGQSWHYIEFKATVRTGINGAYELKVDGVSLLSDGSENTANTGGDGASIFQFNWGGASCRFDDIVIADDTGGIHDDFMGDKVVMGILPDGDGATSQWVPSTGSTHSTLVDDTAASPDDTDYVSSNTDGDVDLYTFGNLTELASDGTLDAVVVFPTAAMFSTGARGCTVRFRTSGGSTADSAQFDVDSKTLRMFIVPFDEDPVAASAWTKTALDGGQLGIVDVTEV